MAKTKITTIERKSFFWVDNIEFIY